MTTITDNSETLFWKVIHNIYLFNKIINSIHNSGDIEYDDVNKININNRIKFKEITSLEWMIKHGQYELLKCKLQAREEIEIEETTIHDMVTELNQKEDTASPPLLESLKLLLKYKPEGLCDNNLLDFLFINDYYIVNAQLVKVISTYQTVYPSVLEHEIRYSKSVDIVETLINSPLITISTSTKNKSISLAFKNVNCKEEMIQLILNNPQLYSVPSSSSSSASDDGTSETLGLKVSDKDDIIMKVSLLDILSLGSIDNQDKLIKLGYYFVPEEIIEQMGDIINNKEQVHKLLLVNKFQYYSYLRYINKYGETIDELGKQVEGSPTLLKFGQFEDGKDIIIDKSYLEYIKTLEFSNSKDYDTFFSDQFISTFVPESNSSKQLSFEFIKCYLESNILENHHYHQNYNQTVESLITTYITELGSNRQDFEDALKLISNTSLGNKLPSKWNKFLLDLKVFWRNDNVIKDEETIDWLSNTNEFWIRSFIPERITSNDDSSNLVMGSINKIFQVKYETSELVEYAHITIGSNSPLSFPFDTTNDKSKQYEWPFLNALSNCNIKELSRISSKFEQNDEIGKHSYRFRGFNKDITTLNIIELIQYFNSNDYKNIGENLFRKIVLSISKITKENSNINLGEIAEIKFTKYPMPCLEIHPSANNLNGIQYATLSPILCQLMINTNDEFNLFLEKPSNFEFNIDFILFQIQRRGTPLDNTFPKSFKSTHNSEHIVVCIESLVGKIKIVKDYTEFDYYYRVIGELVNILFKQLIQIDKLSIKTLKYVYSIINEINNIEYMNVPNQSVFHSFYYLFLKSPKLEKYLLGIPLLTKVFDGPDEPLQGYLADFDYNYQGYNISKYLNPQVFTFEYIFGKCTNNEEEEGEEDNGASFDEIIDKLIHHTSHLPGLQDNQMVNHESNVGKENYYHNGSFNYNLEYFLEIKRQDLFFKELEYIQQFENILDQHIYQTFSSTQQQGIPMLDYQFGLNDFTFSGKVIQYADRVMDIESFQKLVSFNSYTPIIKMIKEFEVLVGSPFTCTPEYLFNYNGIINKILVENDFTKYWSLLNSHQILQNQRNNPEINSLQTIKRLNMVYYFDSIFENQGYDLKFHQLLFKLFPNDRPLITIKISDVDKAIKNKKINFLKFYIENNLIKDHNVIQYLKTTLSNHYDFKNFNINWPN